MEPRTFEELHPLTVKVTITNGGVVTVENKSTDNDYRRIAGLAVNFDDTTNLAGSEFNFKLGGRSKWKNALPTTLLTHNSSCPVNDRYFNYIDEKVNNSLIEIEYTPGAAFPAGNTVITVTFMCSKYAGDE